MIILVWGAATLLGLGVAATTRIGPILFSVSANHGVHLGDLVAFAAAYGAALVTTLRRSGTTATRGIRRGARPAAERVASDAVPDAAA